MQNIALSAMGTRSAPSRDPAWFMYLVDPPLAKDEDEPDTARSPQNGATEVDGFTSVDGFDRAAPQKRVVVRRQLTQQERDEKDRDAITKFFRRLFAEFVGTTIFIWCIAASAVEFNMTANLDKRSAAGLNQLGGGIASGLTLTFLIFAIGGISGAHFNPVITWAFTLRGLFPAIWLPFYWIAQFAGAILAGGILNGFYSIDAHYGTTSVNPNNQYVTGFLYEWWITFIFINVILAMATKGGNVGVQAAAADGLAFAVVSMIGFSYTGVGVNPFRSLGLGIVNGPRHDLWVYVAGPFLGSTCSIVCVYLLNGPLKESDYNAAQGKGENDSPETDEQKDS